jgi:hypothetical protein
MSEKRAREEEGDVGNTPKRYVSCLPCRTRRLGSRLFFFNYKVRRHPAVLCWDTPHFNLSGGRKNWIGTPRSRGCLTEQTSKEVHISSGCAPSALPRESSPNGELTHIPADVLTDNKADGEDMSSQHRPCKGKQPPTAKKPQGSVPAKRGRRGNKK